MQGASPLASPGLGGARHWWTMPVAKERGDRGRGTSAFEMVLSPGAGRTSAAGVLTFFAACPPCLCFTFLAPIPPTPFPGGEGGDQSYFMQGASPLASPGLGGARHWERGANHAPGGGVPGWLSAVPDDCFLFCPLSPLPPSPVGKGEIFTLFRRGLPPPAPLRLSLYGAGSTFGKQFLSVMPRTFPFNNMIEKSSGGSGGLFQESPSVF